MKNVSITSGSRQAGKSAPFGAVVVASVVAVFAFLVGTPVTPLTDAAAATSISGTAVTDTGSRVSGARIYLYRYESGAWRNLGWVATTSSTGTYYIGGLSNWYWYVARAYKVFGSCFTGAAIYDGWSQMLWATGGARGANIRLSFVRWVYC